MKFEWPKFSQTIEWETSLEEIAMILNIFKELGNTVSFVGGPYDGIGFPVRGDLPKMMLLDGNGLWIFYQRVDCDYWTAYEFYGALEAP